MPTATGELVDRARRGKFPGAQRGDRKQFDQPAYR
jgi:hypothetical protein